MPRAKKDAGALTPVELAAVLVAGNPQMRDRLTRIFDMAIADVERVFRFGDAREKAVYVRQLVPAMLKGMQEAEADAGGAAMQETFDRVLAMLGGGDGGPSPPTQG